MYLEVIPSSRYLEVTLRVNICVVKQIKKGLNFKKNDLEEFLAEADLMRFYRNTKSFPKNQQRNAPTQKRRGSFGNVF
jgi:3-methyladenine DNA glycosylase Tag